MLSGSSLRLLLPGLLRLGFLLFRPRLSLLLFRTRLGMLRLLRLSLLLFRTRLSVLRLLRLSLLLFRTRLGALRLGLCFLLPRRLGMLLRRSRFLLPGLRLRSFFSPSCCALKLTAAAKNKTAPTLATALNVFIII